MLKRKLVIFNLDTTISVSHLRDRFSFDNQAASLSYGRLV